MCDEPFALLLSEYQRAPVKGFVARQMESKNRRVFAEHLNMHVLWVDILIGRRGFSLSQRVEELFEKSFDF